MVRLPDASDSDIDLDDDEDHHPAAPISSSSSSSSRTIIHRDNNNYDTSRRRALQGLLVGATATASTSVTSLVLLTAPPPAHAGIPEYDSSGQLYSPKSEMLSGGSRAARGGIPVSGSRMQLQQGDAVQSIYETRFVAYLARFLLNFDPAAQAWWLKQGLGESWERNSELAAARSSSSSSSSASASSSTSAAAAARDDSVVFCEFAESVEVGLADYFSGPFGSYSSVSAAAAGIGAAQPAKSARPSSSASRLVDRIFFWRHSATKGVTTGSSDKNALALAMQGVLNLYALLKARYTSVAAKRQLAILFSFISTPGLQPVNEIRSLLGEADNCTITKISIQSSTTTTTTTVGGSSTSRGKSSRRSTADASFRTSCRRGGGYTLGSFPVVTIDVPPPLGDKYRPAKLRPVMESTTRVLSINVMDGGEGYTSPPAVNIVQGGIQRVCQATAILDRHGHVESVLVLDPGLGYGGRSGELAPRIVIEPPKPNSTQRQPKTPSQEEDATAPQPMRRAKAVADMEYEIVGILVLDGGNGFVATETPVVTIPLPDKDPDWFLSVQEQPEMRFTPVVEGGELQAIVFEMTYPDGNIAFSTAMPKKTSRRVDQGLLERLARDPLELLPSSIRPTLRKDPKSGTLLYTIPSLPSSKQNNIAAEKLLPRYRAYDPIFGGVGRVPVTKGAAALSVSEYARLALSGAVCTVVVRTLLNPLELIKTKQQLENDVELLSFAREKLKSKQQQQQPPPLVDAPKSSPAGPPGSTSSRGTGLAVVVPVTASDNTSAVAIQASVSSTAAAAAVMTTPAPPQPVIKVGTVDLIRSALELRGWPSLFQSADITFLASLVFGSFGFGATELFRRSFASVLGPATGESGGGGKELVLLVAAAVATVVTSAMASPLEVLRVRSMGLVEPKKWTLVLRDFLDENGVTRSSNAIVTATQSSSNSGSNDKNEDDDDNFDWKSLRPQDLLPLWSGFGPTLNRELPFAVAKFLTFDILATTMVTFLNDQTPEGALPIQVGAGTVGLAVSAAAGALAGIAGAVVSHPADLILTKTSAATQPRSGTSTMDTTENERSGDDGDVNSVGVVMEQQQQPTKRLKRPDWREIVKDLVSKDGGYANLFVGIGARSTFFFLVIGLQFFLYDFVKNLFQVGQDDLSLVLDVFYAVRAGLVGVMDTTDLL